MKWLKNLSDFGWKSIKKIDKDLRPGLIVLLIVLIMNIVLQDNFFKYPVVKSNLMTFAPLILAAMAQGVIILTGEIDLSLGAAITLINVIAARLMTDSTVNIIGVSLLCIGLGIMLCLLNGFLITYFKLPSMVATFALSTIWFGISLMIMPQPGGYIPAKFYRAYMGSFFGFITVALVIIVLALIIWSIVERRKIFRYIYAVGGNKENAFASGINILKAKLMGYAIAGVFLGVASLTMTAQAATGDASLGTAFTLNSIAACVIGGISLSGGKGKLQGAVFGALTLGLLTNVIFFARVPSLYQELIKGMIIIIALTIGVLPTLRNKRLTV